MKRTLFLNAQGDDDNDGLTFETAKRTMDGIEKIVKPGDIVWVGGKDGPPPRISGKVIASGSVISQHPIVS